MRVAWVVAVGLLGCDRSGSGGEDFTPLAGEVRAGGVPDANAQVAKMKSRFRACYERGLERDPDLSGSVRLDAKIGAEGDVVEVGAGNGGLAPIVPCLKSVVSS